MVTPENKRMIERAAEEYAVARRHVRNRDELTSARIDLLNAASGIELDLGDTDTTLETWLNYIESLERKNYPDFDVASLAHELSYYVKWAQEYYPRRDRNRAIREELEIARSDEDRDGMPSGKYEIAGDKFLRVGDAEDLVRYHGTVIPKGTIIEKFKPSLGNTDSINRPSIGNIPAVYSTPDADAALEYALGYNNAFVQPGKEGQLYSVTIKPDEIIDLGHCQDDESARLAIKNGIDVIECPDFWEQPETIVFDPDIIEVNAIYPVIDAPDTKDFDDHKWASEGDKKVDELKAQGFLGDSIYQGGDRISKVQDAVDEYKGIHDTPKSSHGSIGVMDKFPSMFGKAPASAPKRGRGQMSR